MTITIGNCADCGAESVALYQATDPEGNTFFFCEPCCVEMGVCAVE